MYLDAIAQMKDGQMVLGDCASGGRRLDIEMLRRMTVNSRSDNCMECANRQPVMLCAVKLTKGSGCAAHSRVRATRTP